jgi:hypothetical protein
MILNNKQPSWFFFFFALSSSVSWFVLVCVCARPLTMENEKDNEKEKEKDKEKTEEIDMRMLRNPQPNRWVADEEVDNCARCKRQFSIILWKVSLHFLSLSLHCSLPLRVCLGVDERLDITQKHHCRNCGRIFCEDCSNRKSPLPIYGYPEDQPVRLCESCWIVRRSYWEEGESTEENCVIDPITGKFRFGTLNKIIEHVTSHINLGSFQLNLLFLKKKKKTNKKKKHFLHSNDFFFLSHFLTSFICIRLGLGKLVPDHLS